MGFNFEFNPQNFGAGVLAGWASAYGIYRARHVLGALRQSVTEQTTSAQTAAMRSADSRYISDLITICETTHLAGRYVNLSQIVVEPRFIAAPELIAPPEDDVKQDVFYVVPKCPDFPYLHAPYNIETLSIEDLGSGAGAVALLGLPGSGRTTAMLTIALWGLGQVRFDPPKDIVQIRLDEEEATLSNEERTNRRKERLMMEQRAKERFAEEKGKAKESESDAAAKDGALFQRLMPVYVHMANINLSEFGKTVDPAEPLVRAVQSQMRRITAKTLPRKLYQRLNKGQALVLIDGYDDLPENEQKHKLVWLNAFVKAYGHNFIIVAGPAQGYGPLTSAGLTPVFMRPWSPQDGAQAVDRWAEAWGIISSGKRRRTNAKVDDSLILKVKQNLRALSPAELTLKIWDGFAEPGDTSPTRWFNTFIKKHGIADEARSRLALAARLQLEDGYITFGRLEAALSGEALPAVETAPEDSAADDEAFLDSEADLENVFGDSGEDDELDQLFEETAPPPPPKTPAKAAPKEKPRPKKDSSKLGKEIAALFKSLLASGLLVMYRGGRYQFRHPQIAVYLASLTLQQASAEELVDKAANAAWRQAIGYAALHRSIDTVVSAFMDSPADMLYNHLLELTRWLPFAGTKVEWRAQLLRQLGNQFVAPGQYTLVRERIAAALTSSQDPGVLKIFHAALRNANPDVRRLACLGIGALGDADSAPDLAAMLQDPVNEVQLAAAMGLGAVGTPDALEMMVEALTTGTEQLRQAIAETFAAVPDEGYPVLYDAINHEEMMLRRAAVFGLRRIKTAWALVAVYRAFLEDQQWYVRSAAQLAFENMQFRQNAGVKAYPKPDTIAWLRSWIESMGENAPQEESAEQLLVSALQDDEPLIRALSAGTLGQLGVTTAVGALYTALTDREEVVRDTAQRALADLQSQIGRALPAPL